MTLVGALVEYEDALRASLQSEYGLRLLPRDYGRTEPERTPLELADLVAHLPPGCALWRATGGGLAWSSESFLLAEVELGVRTVAWMQSKDGAEGRNRPQRIEPPRPSHEIAAKEAQDRAKGEAWLARRRGQR